MFVNYLSHGLFKPWPIFARINSPIVNVISIRSTIVRDKNFFVASEHVLLGIFRVRDRISD